MALWTFTACQMPCMGFCKAHYWTVWRFFEHQYLPFWLFIFLLNVNHDASGKETSFYILFLSSTEPIISQFSTILYIALLHITVNGGSVVKAFGDFFPWFILCNCNRPRPRLSDVLVQYRGVYQVLLPAMQLTVAIRQPRCGYEAHTCRACIFLCCRTQ